MNRIIKFRAWDKKEKRFLKQEEFIYFAISGVAYNVVSEPYKEEQESTIELQQFTGLKDKKGVEIYEGDIIKGKFDVNEVEDWMWLNLTDEQKEKGEILFEIKIPDVYQNAMPEDIEGIGNIYQNKELLK